MKRIHIIGRKNHGKTTLVVDLVQALAKLGLRVGTIKHTHHHHELDTPGKDSHQHRESGAAVVGICSPSMNAVFWPNRRDEANETPKQEIKYAKFAPAYEECDLVLVEGDTQTTATKIEVWRSAVGTKPLAQSDKSIAAVITNDTPEIELVAPLWDRSGVDSIAERIIELLGSNSN